MDVLVLTTMKNAAKCDTKSELQNPVNLYVFERMLRFRVLLEACLFECLFSPLAFSSLVEDGADFGVSGRLPFYEGSLPRLPKWRDDETALPFAVGNTLSTQTLTNVVRRKSKQCSGNGTLPSSQ